MFLVTSTWIGGGGGFLPRFLLFWMDMSFKTSKGPSSGVQPDRWATTAEVNDRCMMDESVYTPLKTHMDPENHWLVKETSLSGCPSNRVHVSFLWCFHPYHGLRN